GGLPPGTRPPAPVGVAGERLRALAPRGEPRLPAGSGRAAGRGRGHRRDRGAAALRRVPASARPRMGRPAAGPDALMSEQSDATPGDDVIRRHLTVSGRVQNVFFRETLRRMAVEAGVTGWARNTRDGVEAALEGPRDVVESL